LLFLKIDSTLRGHPAMDLKVVLAATGRRRVWVCPAFPATGRVVENGWLRVTSDATFAPVDLRPLFRGATVFDAAGEEELRRLAAAALRETEPPLLVGSAGLARELACVLSRREPLAPARPEPRAGVLRAVIGSVTAVTARQLDYLAAHPVPAVETLRFDWTENGYRDLRRRLRNWRPADTAGLILSGGDMATLVLDQLGARGIGLQAEVLPGVPWGRVRGGACDSVPVATKSGSFGDADTLARVALFFAAVPNAS
jgi:uncharacterized protein YgbK (DUF1537 family)